MMPPSSVKQQVEFINLLREVMIHEKEALTFFKKILNDTLQHSWWWNHVMMGHVFDR
jgi:hypothetical protein